MTELEKERDYYRTLCASHQEELKTLRARIEQLEKQLKDEHANSIFTGDPADPDAV